MAIQLLILTVALRLVKPVPGVSVPAVWTGNKLLYPTHVGNTIAW